MKVCIQYAVQGLNANINQDIITLSYMKTSTPVPFSDVQSEVLKNFIAIQDYTDVISFINKYGSIFKRKYGDIRFQEIKNESEVLKNILRMITILKKTKQAYDLIEKIKTLNLYFLNDVIKEYMQQLGKLNEYNKIDFWKNDKYKAGDAIRELLYFTNNEYEIEKDEDNEYIYVGLNGIPIDDLRIDIYHILNTLFTRILSHVTLQTHYIEKDYNFINIQEVDSLLEAIYLYVYNSLDTDNSIRTCNNPNCDNIIINKNERQDYCCDACRNRYNKKKNSHNPIELCINKYRQRAYNAYANNIIDKYTQEKINQDLLNKRNKLLKDNVQDIKIYEEAFTKILNKYIK